MKQKEEYSMKDKEMIVKYFQYIAQKYSDTIEINKKGIPVLKINGIPVHSIDRKSVVQGKSVA